MIVASSRPCEVCTTLFVERHGRVRTCSRRCGYVLRGRTRQTTFAADRASGKIKGRYKDAAGYIRVLVDVGNWRLEHRVVMEGTLHRNLEDHERVHHRNGNRSDNRPENLELWKVKSKDPAGVRASDYHCAGCACQQIFKL